MKHPSTFLSACLLVLFHSSTTTASCTSFTATSLLYQIYTPNAPGRPYSETGIRVSPAQTCVNAEPNYDPSDPSGTGFNCQYPGCLIVAAAEIAVQGYSYPYLNDTDATVLFDLASSNVSSQASADGTDWAFTVSGTVDGNGFCMNNNTSAYVAIWPTLQCVNGTVHGCSNGLEEGTEVQLCGGFTTHSSTPVNTPVRIAGQYALINITAADAASLSGSPNMTSAAAGGWGLGRGGGGLVEIWRWAAGMGLVAAGVSLLG